MKKLLLAATCFLVLLSCKTTQQQNTKPTICLVGGTPSSIKILDEIPAELKQQYHFISFNRPGYGNTPNATLTKDLLYDLAQKAGLHKNDYAVIGISGGGPLAILIAHEFKLQHCGVISGMVPAKEYFAFADSTFTKPLMTSVLHGFDEFNKTVQSFPNLDKVLAQADSPLDTAIRASYNDLHFILSDNNFTQNIFNNTTINWLHGGHDKNVARQSAALFLTNFKHASLQILPDETHAVNANVLIKMLLEKWKR